MLHINIVPLGLPIVHILVLLVLAFVGHEQRIIVLPMMSGRAANIGLFSIILVECRQYTILPAKTG